MSKRFLIVVGLPKSGTTFLYSECAKRPDAFAMPVHVKEVDYFRRGADYDQYRAMFDPEGDKVVVDASPLYIDNIEQSVANIKTALEGHEVRIVVCLRDPLERAFSHYLHDVTVHQKQLGHADYSFWSPTVMAKYIYPLEPRVRFLQEAFGAQNVYGFAFGRDMTRIEDMLRDFAGLGPDWRLDLRDNPAPGFTAPQVYYNATLDSEVPLRGARYLLPKGQLLVVNRQFSLLRKQIGRPLAEQIVMRQSSLTRQFDTATLEEMTHDRLYDDMEAAGGLMGLELGFDRSPRVMHSKPSADLPDHLLAQMRRLGSLDEAVAQLMGLGLMPTMKSTLEMPHEGASLAREMARMQLVQAGDPAEEMSTFDLQQQVVETFGPIPLYIEALMRWHVARKQYDEALALFEPYGGAGKLLWPMDLVPFLNARQITLDEDVATRFERAGVRVWAPKAG